MDIETWVRKRFDILGPVLNERQRRLLAAADAQALGHGGVTLVSRATGLSRPTVQRGLKDLAAGPEEMSRARRPGGGRKRTTEKDPSLLGDLEALVDPTERGDPESPLRWTCKSTRHLAKALTERGHAVSHRLVAELLAEQGYSLQANMKTLEEGSGHPDRDSQFRYIDRTARRFMKQKCPVISVDAKKKELVGPFKNAGEEWRQKGRRRLVNGHDFADPELGRAFPYGVYDVGKNQGWVSVGCDHDTAAFAVSSVRRWWHAMGEQLYAAASRLLICADGGGSNGYRLRLWKVELQALANETGLDITVCHYPPGTSKWNKIEHRLFSQISMNWRGQPLVSHEVVVALIAATTTTTGLTVQAAFDPTAYPTKVRVTDEQLAAVRLRPHRERGKWNYTIEAVR